MRAVLTGLLLLTACAEEKGVCEEQIVQAGAREGFCVEMDSPAQCPVADSGDESDEFQWFWHKKGSCPDVGYDIDCGEGIWVNLESLCPSEDGT